MKGELGRVAAYRARREREATLRFAALADALTAIRAAPDWVSRARAASEDEARHERLCTDFAATHGVAVEPGAEPHDSVAPPGWSLEDVVLYDVVATCCVAETLNAALLTAELEIEGEPALLALTRALLRDEVQHARFGWAYLGAVASAREVKVLQPHLRQLVLGAVGGETTPDEAQRAGARTARVVQETLREVIWPGLAVHGLFEAAS